MRNGDLNFAPSVALIDGMKVNLNRCDVVLLVSDEGNVEFGSNTNLKGIGCNCHLFVVVLCNKFKNRIPILRVSKCYSFNVTSKYLLIKGVSA